jgi:hypothetical protein
MNPSLNSREVAEEVSKREVSVVAAEAAEVTRKAAITVETAEAAASTEITNLLQINEP